jgi:pimeloyl-ACP methyl ester carboxylesterase
MTTQTSWFQTLFRRGRPVVARTLACGFIGVMLSLGPVVHADARPWQDASARRAAPLTEVVLLRGLFNVFSLGMDDLGGKLQAQRAVVKVSNHASWSQLADDIIARRKGGEPPTRLVLIGHSLGGNDIISMAARLGQGGVGVDLLIPIDATAPSPVPANVRRVVNYYQSANGFGSIVVGARQFRGNLINSDLSANRRDLASSDIGHTTIDKSMRIHREIVSLVANLSVARQPRQGRRATTSARMPE